LRDVTAIGRVGVDLYSLDYNVPLEDVKKFAKYVGGGAANLAVALSRLGLNVSILSGVSDDELGEFVIDFLRKEKVNVDHLKKFKDAKTGIVFAEVFPGKESKFIFYRENAADLLITKEDVDKASVFDSKVIVTTGTGLSANPSREASLYAMEIGRNHGRKVLLNLDWRPSLWKGIEPGLIIRHYADAIKLATILVGNESEFMAATGSQSVDQAISKIPVRDEKLLILTRGELGSRAYTPDGKVIDAMPFRVEPLKTLGAGDGNLAGIIYGSLKEWDICKTLRFGSAIGAIVVTRHSCSEAMPQYDETMKFIEKMGGF
jgi:5-dehydro-2-deoxygluconokinase